MSHLHHNLQHSRDTTLNETKMEGVQSESTPSPSSEKEFVVSNDNPSSEPSQDVPRENSKATKGMASGLVDCYQGGGAHHHCIFGGAPKY